ncbi:MAG: Rv3235 family protein [Mycobacterium sp.]
MTTSPSTGSVTRIVDYEPPLAASSALGHSRVPSHGRGTRRIRPLHPPPSTPASAPRRQAAAAFADAALRTVLEVIDQRRPPGQVRPLLMGGLADTVIALSRATSRGDGAAVLRRVRLQAADTEGAAFEVAAVYSRGARTHAMACRVELAPTAREPRWQLVALHIG